MVSNSRDTGFEVLEVTGFNFAPVYQDILVDDTKLNHSALGFLQQLLDVWPYRAKMSDVEMIALFNVLQQKVMTITTLHEENNCQVAVKIAKLASANH